MATLKDRLLELTDEHALPGAAALVTAFVTGGALDVPLRDAEIEPPASDLPSLLQQLARRGLDPRLVPSLLLHFENRPLEKGLVAWDILCGAVWPNAEEDLIGELRGAAELLEEIVATPQQRCFDLNAHPSTAMIAKYAIGAVENAFEEAKQNGLGALELLRSRGGKAAEVVTSPSARRGLTSLGRLFAHAHLPSLASLYLDYAARALGHMDAVPSLCETMLDAGTANRIPAELMGGGDRSPSEWIDFAEYLLYRTHFVEGRSIKAYSLLETNRHNRGEQPASDRFVVMQGLLAPLFDDAPPPFSRLDEIAKNHELWSLAWGVRMSAAATESPRESMVPLEIAADYVARFGHEWRAWYHAFRCASRVHGVGVNVPWKLAACASIGQDLTWLPHDANAWKALIMLIADDDSVNEGVEEIEAHLFDQSEL